MSIFDKIKKCRNEIKMINKFKIALKGNKY